MTTRHVDASPPPEHEEEIYLLDNVSWETYELLLRDRDAVNEHFRITYDRGRMQIDRRGADVQALDGISWETYEHLLRDLEGQNFRLTYDQGRLSIVSPTHRHDKVRTLIGRMIELLSLELGIVVSSFGSATWRRNDVFKGLEPDECYYVQNEPRVRGKDELDLTVDPPPDLAIEVDVTRHFTPRLPVYAALGIPEVWQFRGKHLRAMALKGGAYQSIETSIAFPMLRPADLEPFLAMRQGVDENTLMTRFRDWVRTLPRPTSQP
jgi:Uma2 family endonuclease